MTKTDYLDVALALPAPGIFQYQVPPALREPVEIGKRVFVSVRNRRMVGYAVGFSETRAFKELKSIDSVIDESPILDQDRLDLTRWMADYYLCSWGQAIEATLPAPFKKGKWRMKSRSKKMTDRLGTEATVDLKLTEHQEKAHRTIYEKLAEKKPGVFLLHGITGSGKTEIYMQLIRDVLEQGRGAIVLVPEISLTPQTVERFHSRFGTELAVMHSRLTEAHRVEEWHRIRSGAARVVVGARSAVFSPVKALGLIVIDEEQETSYKQGETPRYETRGVARKRCELESAVLVMGSATPSLEATHDTETGKSVRLELPERIEKRPLPIVTVVDMRKEFVGKGERIFSKPLEEAVRHSLSKNEQVMLLLNRRGFSTYLHCPSCGFVMSCPNCRISLAYHFDRGVLLCHVCHYRSKPERLCPGCRKSHLHYFGIGTQKVEGEALRLFPGARIARMDSDSTARKDSHETILTAFKDKRTDLLIGTQMIAKGHDFPNVSLIGVISADTALHLADFRAAERTFDLLTQVAGRTGRGSIPGRVIVQTTVPQHYSIQSAKDHDYHEFYEKEMLFRKELRMPPYSHLINLILACADERSLARQALTFAAALKSRMDKGSMAVLGPAPCPVSKEKGLFRWQLYLKGDTIEELRPVLETALNDFKKDRLTVTVDVDPQ